MLALLSLINGREEMIILLKKKSGMKTTAEQSKTNRPCLPADETLQRMHAHPKEEEEAEAEAEEDETSMTQVSKFARISQEETSCDIPVSTPVTPQVSNPPKNA
jgi:hypothetical protein